METPEKQKETLMAVREVYIAVYARIDDGKIVTFAVDAEAPIGSSDGNVWHEDTEEWHNDWDDATDPKAMTLLSEALDRINKNLDG